MYRFVIKCVQYFDVAFNADAFIFAGMGVKKLWRGVGNCNLESSPLSQ